MKGVHYGTDNDHCQNANICNAAGIDRGINFVAATYDGKHKSGFVNGKAIKQKRANYSKLRKELQMRQTPFNLTACINSWWLIDRQV